MVQPAACSTLAGDTNLIVLSIASMRAPGIPSRGRYGVQAVVLGRISRQIATVKWPCNLLTPIASPLTPANFNLSELQAYKASTALTNYLGQLHAEFPGCRLHLLAHSQANGIVSEAINQGGVSFDTYILTQGALPDSAYDVNAPTNSGLLSYDMPAIIALIGRQWGITAFTPILLAIL